MLHNTLCLQFPCARPVQWGSLWVRTTYPVYSMQGFKREMSRCPTRWVILIPRRGATDAGAAGGRGRRAREGLLRRPRSPRAERSRGSAALLSPSTRPPPGITCRLLLQSGRDTSVSHSLAQSVRASPRGGTRELPRAPRDYSANSPHLTSNFERRPL